jgi:hypothetical protein
MNASCIVKGKKRVKRRNCVRALPSDGEQLTAS